MKIVVHYFNGNDQSIQNHYLQKDYRNDIAVEIDGIFYEVYFFTKDSLEYEMRTDGFFSLPGIIILDKIENAKIHNSIRFLADAKFFDCFSGYSKEIMKQRFSERWYLATYDDFKPENACVEILK